MQGPRVGFIIVHVICMQLGRDGGGERGEEKGKREEGNGEERKERSEKV